MNYYNEFDPKAAAWLQELINQKLIPDGVVDTRSIKDVRANDLRGFTQCHFFAGIGGWSYALELAGVAPGESLWTGSCPCQPYSQAGKGKGFDDERDLWPVWFNLIKECRPPKIFGEQVERAIKHGWLDRVYADMEAEGYACGSVVLGAHSVGAPHQRQRLYWGCQLSDSGMCGRASNSNGRTDCESKEKGRLLKSSGTGNDNDLAYSERNESRAPQRQENQKRSDGQFDNRNGIRNDYRNSGAIGSFPMVNGIKKRLEGYSGDGTNRKESGRDKTKQSGSITKTSSNGILGNSESNNELRDSDQQNGTGKQVGRSSGTNNLSNLSPWDDFTLVLCRDTDKDGNHKVRRVPAESVFQRMDDGVSESMDISRADSGFPLCQSSSFKKGEIAQLLKGYGNAIVPQVAAIFIKSFINKENSL